MLPWDRPCLKVVKFHYEMSIDKIRAFFKFISMATVITRSRKQFYFLRAARLDPLRRGTALRRMTRWRPKMFFRKHSNSNINKVEGLPREHSLT